MPDINVNLPAQGPPGPVGAAGADGAPGDTGPRGPALAPTWNYVADYDAAGPGTGEIMFDTSGGGISAVLFESHNPEGVSVLPWLQVIGTSTNPVNKGTIHVVQISNESHWYIFTVTNIATEFVAGKYSLPVTLLTSSGIPIEDEERVAVSFYPTGNKGSDGIGGDMFGTNNLSELTDPALAFETIKQSATTTTTGVNYFLRNYLTGLTTSNNSADYDHDISIAPGMAADSANTVMMSRAATLVKGIDSGWAVGNGGGLDTGSVAIDTWYYIYLIRRNDTGVVDACFSLSNTAPTIGANIPAAYDAWRRIGSVRTDSSANILRFRQYGDYFIWDVGFSEFTGDSSGITFICAGVPKLANPPIGIFTHTMQCYYGETNVGRLSDTNSSYVSHNDGETLYQGNTTTGIIYVSSEVLVRVSQSGQVTWSSDAYRYIRIINRGYIDHRDRI